MSKHHACAKGRSGLAIMHTKERIIGRFVEKNSRFLILDVDGRRRRIPWSAVRTFGPLREPSSMNSASGHYTSICGDTSCGLQSCIQSSLATLGGKLNATAHEAGKVAKRLSEVQRQKRELEKQLAESRKEVETLREMVAKVLSRAGQKSKCGPCGADVYYLRTKYGKGPAYQLDGSRHKESCPSKT